MLMVYASQSCSALGVWAQCNANKSPAFAVACCFFSYPFVCWTGWLIAPVCSHVLKLVVFARFAACMGLVMAECCLAVVERRVVVDVKQSVCACCCCGLSAAYPLIGNRCSPVHRLPVPVLVLPRGYAATSAGSNMPVLLQEVQSDWQQQQQQQQVLMPAALLTDQLWSVGQHPRCACSLVGVKLGAACAVLAKATVSESLSCSGH
jgi:hypothetical protein